MFAIKVGDEFLDLAPNGSLTLEQNSPFFSNDTIPGAYSFPTPAINSKTNQRKLGFPSIISNQSNLNNIIEAQLFIDKILYKTGVIRNIKPTKDGYSFTFGTDAGDFQSRITGVSMQSIDLGTDTLNLVTTNTNYALFPVSNVGFWGDKNSLFEGYVNYYNVGGTFATYSDLNVVTPFPYLVYILRKTFHVFGYEVEGAFLEDALINKLVIYNNYALNSTSIAFNNHVPDMTVGEFIIAIKNMFGLGFVFNPTGKKVKIISYNEVLANQSYKDFTRKADPLYQIDPNESNGFKLVQEMDSLDEALKSESDSWITYKIGNGADEKTTKVSTTLCQQVDDSIYPARSWTVPVVNQKGTSSLHELGTNKFTFRLLFYNGMQPDSASNLYPQGAHTISGRSLRWSGTNGLYNIDFKDWLDFLAETKPVSWNIRFNIVDLLTNQMEEKKMIDYNKFLLSKITTQISQKDGMKPSKTETFKVRL
jgi:hypothetical protein